MENNDQKEFKLEWYRFWGDIFKWCIGGVVIITGFLMIRPQEQDRLERALQLEIHKAYIAAANTEDIKPDFSRVISTPGR